MILISFFFFSFFICYSLTPLVIKASLKKNIFAKVGGRNSHDGEIPNIGGVAIYFSISLSLLLLLFYNISFNNTLIKIDYYQTFCFFLILSFLFIIGYLDDKRILKSIFFRFFFQIIASLSVVILLDIRIESFSGLFGFYDLSYPFSLFFSSLVFVFIINAINFIDGLDGLASVISAFMLVCFLGIFIFNQNYFLAFICVVTLGAILAFLKFNISPAKVFMGDCGSLILGCIIAIFCLKSCNLSINNFGMLNPVFILSIIAYPAIDTLRVLSIRITDGVSPFYADRNHFHHMLIDNRFSHLSATIYILIYSISIFFICLILRNDINLSFFVTAFFALLFIFLPIPRYINNKFLK
jgi:UDP-GlcNAc:undecaprenyl-phosphate/decaprenyl-phosphate GlcNAc-1-phosphate transferase